MKILFVCHGNICRSPMAEFVMKDLLRKEGRDDVVVESAALHEDAIGCNTHRGTRAKLDEKGIPHPRREAWLLTSEKASEYDLIIGMDRYNMSDLEYLVRPEDRGILDPERVVDSVALLRLVNPSTPLRFAGGRRDMSDEIAAKCIYVGMSAGIAGPLLTTPGADFDDDRHLAVQAGYKVGRDLV